MSSTAFEIREASLQRTPVYKAVFATGPTTFSTARVRVRVDFLTDTDTVDETFAIDEAKVYTDEWSPFPAVDHSPLGDMFPWLTVWTLATSFAYMHLPSTTAPMQIYPDQGHCSVGSVLLTLEDIGEEATALVAQVLIGQHVELWGGFHGMDGDDDMLVYKGTVQSIRMTPGLTGYEIQLHNTQTLVNKQLFQKASSTLLFDIGETDLDLAIHPSQIASFTEPGYLLVGSEVIRYETLGFALVDDLTRGAWGSVVSSHSAAASVSQIYVLGPAHPIDIRLGIYYGTASNTCLGIGYDDIDWPAFAIARDIIGPDYQAQFFVTGPDNAMEFISRELDIVTGCYPFVTSDGKLSIKAFAPAGAATATFDHDCILSTNGKPEIGWGLGEGNLGQPINDVTINYDLNPVTGVYHSFYQETRPASIANYGRFPIVINSAGLRFNLAGTAQMIVDRVAAILDRYEDGAPVVTIRTHLNKQGSDVGVIAAVTSRVIPNRNTGTKGVTAAKAEIINRAIQWAQGYVDFTLLGQDAQL